MRISVILDRTWASKGPKTFEKGSFHGCSIGMENFEKF